jgi:hypothetical protein
MKQALENTRNIWVLIILGPKMHIVEKFKHKKEHKHKNLHVLHF